MNEIVNEIINNGFEAYIVGGYVRDYILGIKSFDMDICTNASVNDLKKIFNNVGTSDEKYYAYHIIKDDMNYDITTYREEIEYSKNKPIKIRPAKDLKSDLLRRDFTINTLAIDSNGNLVDLLGGKEDIINKKIKVVGNIKDKFTEDKTRLLRAIRFSSTLNFDLDSEIIEFIKKNSGYFNEIPLEFKKKELDKIFNSNHYDKFFKLVKDLKLEKVLNIKFNDIKETYNYYGIWAQIDTNLPFTKDEKKIIDTIKDIVNRNKINLFDIFIYKDVIIKNAASILGMYQDIQYIEDIKKINSIINVDISLSDLASYVKPKDFKKVYKLLERHIMEGNLENNREDIVKFLREDKYE